MFNLFADPATLTLRWWRTGVLVVADLALLTTELIDDNNLHPSKAGRSVSAPTAHLFTGGLVIPIVIGLLVVWLATSGVPVVGDVVLPLVGMAAEVVVVDLTCGAVGVQHFVLLVVVYSAAGWLVTRLLFAPGRALLRLVALCLALMLIASTVGVAAMQF